jgi:hypothetical protein
MLDEILFQIHLASGYYRHNLPGNRLLCYAAPIINGSDKFTTPDSCFHINEPFANNVSYIILNSVTSFYSSSIATASYRLHPDGNPIHTYRN